MFIEERIAELEKQIKEMASTLEKLSWRLEKLPVVPPPDYIYPEKMVTTGLVLENGVLHNEDVTAPVKETAEVKPKEVSSIDYATVKAQINKAAINHRDEIKALNVKFGFKIFADILVDQKYPEKGVKDQAVLEDYYKQLLALGE